jgi:hypothetical protein
MNSNGKPDDGKGPVSKLRRMLIDEATAIPITFIASIVVLVTVIYSAVEFLISPSVLSASNVLSFPKIVSPIPGLNILVKAIGFFVVQGALASIYARTIDTIARLFGNIAIVLFIIAALVYAWLSTFVSFALWVTATPNYIIGILTLAAASFISFMILSIFITSNSSSDKEDNSAAAAAAGIASLVIFGIIFGVYTMDYFVKANS